MKFPELKPPQLRTVLGEADRTATWLELFYDLVFVVAVAVLGTRLSETHEWSGVLTYLAYFFLLWWLWASHTFYADRYDTDDLVYRMLATVQLMAVAIIAASLSNGPAMSTVVFAVGYFIARLALLAMYARARRHVLETRKLVTGYLGGFGIGAAIWGVSIFVPEPARFYLWAVAMVIDLATPWVMRREQARAPLDVSHLPERFGLFTILVLGESVAATVLGLSGVEWSAASTFTALLAIVTATSIWWLYFDNVEGLVVRRDATTRRTWRPTVWIYSHYGLAAGLGITAVGMEHAIGEAGHGEFDDFAKWLLLLGASLVSVGLGLNHLASGSDETYAQHNAVAFSRFLAAILILLVGLVPGLTASGSVASIAVIMVGTAAASPRVDLEVVQD